MPRYYFHLTGGKQVLNNHKRIDLSANAATPYAASGRCPIDNIFSFADAYREGDAAISAVTRTDQMNRRNFEDDSCMDSVLSFGSWRCVLLILPVWRNQSCVVCIGLRCFRQNIADADTE